MIDYWGELVYKESRFRVAEENTEGCFTGRVVAGERWPVIELFGGLDQSLPTARLASFEHTVGKDSVLEKYKNGEKFYFTAKRIDCKKLYLTWCMPTKYFIEIEGLSDTTCGQRE